MTAPAIEEDAPPQKEDPELPPPVGCVLCPGAVQCPPPPPHTHPSYPRGCGGDRHKRGEGAERGGGAGQQEPSNDPCNNRHSPQYAHYWALLPRTRHQTEHRPQRATRIAPAEHAAGGTGDCQSHRTVRRGGPDVRPPPPPKAPGRVGARGLVMGS